MTIFFSPGAVGFYDDEVNSVIPADVIEIDKEVCDALFQGRSHGRRIGVGPDGGPVLLDPAEDYTAAIERAWRDTEIARVTWLRDRHRDELELGGATSITPSQYTELLAFIQSLRDWPQSEAFPDTPRRPEAPPWIADQAQ
jgi:hypothetical protein